ncbi:hypothetical protein LEN26_011911 [Aphanomyces euteiches]|nr:hypothetical protein LEN26_011911 [Aphanomyces euteiches]
MKDDVVEMAIMLLVTGVTNFSMLQTIVMLYRHQMLFEAFMGLFTMITSFMYHCCNSIDAPLYLDEGQWQRLDNIGAIVCFTNLCWYLMDLCDDQTLRALQYGAFGHILIAQEKDPWNPVYTVAPILLSLGAVVAVNFVRGMPNYDKTAFAQGFLAMFVAVLCFARGLDDATDPFRFFHGCWHACVSLAMNYFFRTLPPPYVRSSLLPTDAKFL